VRVSNSSSPWRTVWGSHRPCFLLFFELTSGMASWSLCLHSSSLAVRPLSQPSMRCWKCSWCRAPCVASSIAVNTTSRRRDAEMLIFSGDFLSLAKNENSRRTVAAGFQLARREPKSERKTFSGGHLLLSLYRVKFAAVLEEGVSLWLALGVLRWCVGPLLLPGGVAWGGCIHVR
jgi:type IV secretory pathway TrbD component